MSERKPERKPAPPPPPNKIAGVRRYLAWGVLVVALAGLGGAGVLFANQGNRPVVAPTLVPTTVPTAAPTSPASATAGSVTPSPTTPTTPKPSVRVEHVKGNASAKVTVLEYSDFQCPYCATYATETYPQIDAKYIKTGKVKYIFRPMVSPSHKQAQKAAETAECAGEQSKFWEMHDTLFAKQSLWTEKGGAVEIFKGYAKTLGLDEAAFNICLDSGKYASVPAENGADATKAGVTGTPNFLINNSLLPGAYPIEVFTQIIEQELAK